MKKITQLLLVVVPIVFLFGCAGAAKKDGDAAPIENGSSDGADTSGAGDGGVSGSGLNDPNSPLSGRVVYFELDSSEVSSGDRATVAAHGQHLADNSDEVVTLEGHADERGSREYNLALGERRANTVRQLLLVEGASADQIKTVSYGEEKAVETCHDESCWDANRRVEFVY